MENLVAYIDGIGWWSPGIADWPSACQLLRGENTDTDTFGTTTNTLATALSPNERRRAPESVRLACDVAAQACSMAACDPSSLPCVFASALGDVATTDAICATLASEPLQMSPTRFHNSVHNAAVGYWTIAAQCRAPSSAIAAADGSFAAALLEATLQAHADATSVLFAAYDVAASGALVDVVANTAPFAAALVISHERGPRTRASLHLHHAADAGQVSPVAPALTGLAATNHIAASLPLFAALAGGSITSLALCSGVGTTLAIEVRA